MGRLVASVAHELNNPLQTIKNCLFLTQQDIGPEAITQTYLEMAISETTRLKNLVLQLRDVYRPSGSEEMQPVLVTAVISPGFIHPQTALQGKQHHFAVHATRKRIHRHGRRQSIGSGFTQHLP